jgi:membrane associated rhomboid family serine protease
MIFFPIGDPTPVRYRTRPYATIIIIALNVLVYIWLLTLSEEGYREAAYTLGSSPATIRSQSELAALSMITATFMHAREATLHLHIIGNMVFLWTFGRRVEDACGPFRFVLFYIVCGATASLLHFLIAINRDDASIPSIGASGAVAGVMGAYLVLFYHAKIRTFLWPPPLPFPIPYPIRLRAFWYLIPWFVFQVLLTADAVSGIQQSVGYDAHLGGFLGALLVFLFLRKDALYRYVSGAEL